MRKAKLSKAWATLSLTLTIQGDDEGNIIDVNINDGINSISYDGDYLPTLQELINEFDR